MLKLQVGYARDLLFLLALVFAKLSVCASLFYLSPDALHRRTTAILGGVVGLWGVSSLFAIAFQCGTQGPWASTSCINQVGPYSPIWRQLGQKLTTNSNHSYTTKAC